jgi:hypothetical protein
LLAFVTLRCQTGEILELRCSDTVYLKLKERQYGRAYVKGARLVRFVKKGSV